MTDLIEQLWSEFALVRNDYLSLILQSGELSGEKAKAGERIKLLKQMIALDEDVR